MVVQLTDLAPVDGGVYFDDDGAAMIYGDDEDDDRAGGRRRQHRGRHAHLPVHEVRAGHRPRQVRLSRRHRRIWGGSRRRAGSLARLSACRSIGAVPGSRSVLIPQDVEDFVANIKSQIKRIRTNEVARLRNKSVKSALKTAIRRFREAADSGDRDGALDRAAAASRQLDKAASKGVIHANQAANKKSAMAQRANAL